MNIFKTLIVWIDRLFDKLSPEAKAAVSMAVWVVEGMKRFSDSPLSDIVTAVIPGNADDKLVKSARQVLPKILVTLRIVEGEFDQAETIILSAIEAIKAMPYEARRHALHSIAVELALRISGMSFQESIYYVERYYQKKINNNV